MAMEKVSCYILVITKRPLCIQAAFCSSSDPKFFLFQGCEEEDDERDGSIGRTRSS